MTNMVEFFGRGFFIDSQTLALVEVFRKPGYAAPYSR